MPTLEDDRFSNRETYETYHWISTHAGIPKIATKLMTGSRNVGELADSLEAFLWILWEGKIGSKDSLAPVNWVEVADAWVDDHSLDADEFFNNLQTPTD